MQAPRAKAWRARLRLLQVAASDGSAGDMATRFDLAGQDFKRDPAPTFARMRAQGALVESRMPILGPVTFATTYEAAAGLLRTPELFTVDPRRAGRTSVPGLRWLPPTLRPLTRSMLLTDDPEHRRLRKLADAPFRRQAIDAYRPRIAATADALLDALAASPDGDLVRHFARALPLMVICEIMGVPPEERPRFGRWMARISGASSLIDLVLLLPAARRTSAYLRAHFARRRAVPQDDLISALVQPGNDGDRLSDDELLAMCFLLFVAGHVTTTHLIGGAVLALLQHPEQLGRLQADWSRAPSAVDELLRFLSPVQLSKPRYALRDADFAGGRVKRGEVLMAVLGAANLDPLAFEAPERFDIGREKNRHLAFGQGPHLCLGLHLAQAEAEIALQRLFERYPRLRLAVPESELRWSKNYGLRALKRLPLHLNG
jgi:cytochrome P450